MTVNWMTQFYVTEAHDRLSPPDSLYHYTTQGGLLGIARSRRLWASDLRYLNDCQEFQYGIEFAKRLIIEVWESGGMIDRVTRELLLGEVALAAAKLPPIYVASFSTKSDDLSQWRAYGGTAVGYAIQFHSVYLLELAHAQRCELKKCVYDPAEQKNLLAPVIELALEDFNTGQKNGDEAYMKTAMQNLASHMTRLAPILKHHSFAAEDEWRLFSYSVDGVEFHHGRSTVVPHLPIRLENPTPIAMGTVTVGPSREPLLARDSVQRLLEVLIPGRDYEEKYRVANSQIPYRNW